MGSTSCRDVNHTKSEKFPDKVCESRHFLNIFYSCRAEEHKIRTFYVDAELFLRLNSFSNRSLESKVLPPIEIFTTSIKFTRILFLKFPVWVRFLHSIHYLKEIFLP